MRLRLQTVRLRVLLWWLEVQLRELLRILQLLLLRG